MVSGDDACMTVSGTVAVIAPLVGVVIGSAGSLGAQYLWARASKAHARAERQAALRTERKEAVREFLDCAQEVERIAHHNFSGKRDSDAGSTMHDLWYLQKCIDIVGSPELRRATYEYAQRLADAVWKEMPTDTQTPADVRLQRFIGDHRDRFLRAARHELDIPELS